MKGLKAAIIAFLAGSLAAGYIALAPFGKTVGGVSAGGWLGIVDAPAIALIRAAGRSNAVIALLAGGTVLALLFLLLGGVTGGSAPREKQGRTEPEGDAATEEAPPPAPRTAGDRLQTMRQRAEAEAAAITPFDVHSADAEHAAATDKPRDAASTDPAPRPVMLVRKVRERDRDWFGDASWLGGLPRLGGEAWPVDDNGQPLPFAAQVDLAELASTCPEAPLPKSGSLAFFIGSGAVVHVPEGDHPFTMPPPRLIAAYDEGGYPFPQHSTRLTRDIFRFWPVELIGLDMPEDMRFLGNEERHSEITDAMYALLDHHVPERAESHPDLAGDDDIDGANELWWFAVRHLSDCLHIALERAQERLTNAQRSAEAAAETVAAHEAESEADSGLADSARASLAQARERLEDISGQFADLPAMVAAVEGFAADRDPWQRLTQAETAVVADIIAECRSAFPDLVRYHLPHSVRDLNTLCVREMMTGDDRALSALPESLLDFRNRRHRLTGAAQHQMFGLAACQQHALYDHLDDLLLLQLAYDADMDWLFGDMGLFQFWIRPEDAAAGRWDKAQMTFEMG